MKTNKQTELERQRQQQTKNLWLLKLANQSRQLKKCDSEKSIKISGNLPFHVFYLFYKGNKLKACFKNSIQATTQQDFKLL
jgi:hypothetical protein